MFAARWAATSFPLLTDEAHHLSQVFAKGRRLEVLVFQPDVPLEALSLEFGQHGGDIHATGAEGHIIHLHARHILEVQAAETACAGAGDFHDVEPGACGVAGVETNAHALVAMLGLELFRRLGRIAVGIGCAEVVRLKADGVIVDGKGEVELLQQLRRRGVQPAA